MKGTSLKDLMLLWQVLLLESSSRCCVCTDLDWKTVQARVEEEGESFLTITLPTFAEGLQKGLEQGFVAPSDFPSFSFVRKRGESVGLPKFLRGFLEQIFNSGSGRLLDEPSVEAISCVRQLALSFNKIYHTSKEERVRKAMDGYVSCEKEIRIHDSTRTQEEYLSFARVSHLLFSRLYPKLVSELRDGRLQGRHGPGATADRLRGNSKWDQSEWPWRLERVFPSAGFLVPNDRHYEWLSRLKFLEPGAERPVRVIDVPKTFKTPRIIAIEPTCMMFVQQALSVNWIPLIESDSLIGGMIGFEDQTVNRRMAQDASRTGDMATLDLSEASDRVSNQLVRAMFRWQPLIAEAVDATRSRSADVLGHGVLRLSKFASMGSALTFPIEAMVFLTIIFVAIEGELRRPLTESDIRRLKGQVRVYGDDIIVPVDYARAVADCLEAYGLKVNRSKSFWNGKFRESCGGEYYNGEDVSVVRFRRLLPAHRRYAQVKTGEEAQRLISAVSLANQLHLAGWWRSAAWLTERLEGVIPLPVVTHTSPVLGKWSFLGDYQSERTHRTLHSPLVKGYVPSSKSPSSPLRGSGALMKVFSNPSEPFHWLKDITEIASRDEKHLERAGRPQAVSIKLGWHQPY